MIPLPDLDPYDRGTYEAAPDAHDGDGVRGRVKTAMWELAAVYLTADEYDWAARFLHARVRRVVRRV